MSNGLRIEKKKKKLKGLFCHEIFERKFDFDFYKTKINNRTSKKHMIEYLDL